MEHACVALEGHLCVCLILHLTTLFKLILNSQFITEYADKLNKEMMVEAMLNSVSNDQAKRYELLICPLSKCLCWIIQVLGGLSDNTPWCLLSIKTGGSFVFILISVFITICNRTIVSYR